MRTILNHITTACIAKACAATLALAWACTAAAAEEPVRIAIPAFLTGPAAGPYGIPSRNGAEIIIEAINAGTLPEPYASVGLAGARIEAEYVDEAGGNTLQVDLFRSLVQKSGADVILGYVSSGTCAAVAPIAEELKALTIFTICGTPRIFEEADRQYVFRTQSIATAEAVGAALYIRDTMPDLKGFTGINQNYAWGQDSWNDFEAAMKRLSPARPSANPLWPQVFQGQYGSEISALLLAEEELVHSSFWGSDLDSFILQAQGRGLFARKKVLLTMGGAGAVLRLGSRMPKGAIVGARGPIGIMAKETDTPLNQWFIKAYVDRYGVFPASPAYQTASGLLALKAAYEKAAESARGRPTLEQVRAELKGITYTSLTGPVELGLSNGHQAVTEISFGETDFDSETGEPIIRNVRSYPANCINPPAGMTSSEWLAGEIATCK